MNSNKFSRITIVIIFLCLWSQSKAQAPENDNSKEKTNNYVIEYDFSTGLYNKNTVRPKVHFPMVYRIKNINRYAYKIEVKSKDSVLAFSFSLEGLPKEIFGGQKNEQESVAASINESPKAVPSVNTNDVKDIANETPEKKENLVNILNSTVQILDLNRQIANYNEKHNSISAAIEKNTLLLKSLENDASQSPTVKDSIELEQAKLNTLNEISATEKSTKLGFSDLEKIFNDQINLMTEDEKVKKDLQNLQKDKVDMEALATALKSFLSDSAKLSEIFSEFRATFREVNKINHCYDQLYELISYHQLTFKMAEQKVLRFKEKEKNEFPNYHNQIAILKSKYYDLQVQYGILKRNFALNDKLSEGGKSKLYGQADEYIDRAKNMFEKINLIEVQKKMNLMPMIIKSLDDKDTFEWKSSPVQPIGDVVSFDIDIQAKNKTENKILNERKFRHQEFTYGGTRIDFGLGLAASYFSDTPVYELQVEKVGTLSNITIRKKSNQVIVPSLIGLATMSYRTSQYICYGGSAGLGIDVVNGKIQLSNFFVGPTVTFGRYERLSFTAGASLRNVQQLKSGYEIGFSVTEASDDIENYLTDKYKIGFFASLTFVLTKGMKENLNKIPTYR